MTRKKITLQIINSDKIFLEVETKVILFNGIEGDFMVLPNHEKLLTLVNTGIVKIGSDSNKLKELAITSSGTVEIQNNNCKFFVQRAILVSDIKVNLDTVVNELEVEASKDILDEKWKDPFLVEKVNFFKRIVSLSQNDDINI